MQSGGSGKERGAARERSNRVPTTPNPDGRVVASTVPKLWQKVVEELNLTLTVRSKEG